jgi:energy-converting hydrogenase Eha subunit A
MAIPRGCKTIEENLPSRHEASRSWTAIAKVFPTPVICACRS